jgi:hypothetical protein
MARGLSTARNAPGLRSRKLKEIRVAADKRQLTLLIELEAAGRQLGIDVAPRTSLKRMVSGWENGAPMSADYRKLFCAVYDRTQAELGFAAEDGDRSGTPLGADIDPWELADALTSSPIAVPTLAEMERAVLGYANRYGKTPPTELWPQVSRQMTRMKHAIAAPQPLAVRRQSVVLLGVLSGVAGQLAMDLHRHDRAEGMFSVGRLAATEAGDDDLAAWVAATHSIGPFFAQQYGTAAGFLGDAERLAARASSRRRRAWIAAMHARALAANGDHRQALAALDRAHAQITGVLDEPRGTDFFDAPRFDGISGSVYLLLRDPAQAEEFIGRALNHRSTADHKGRALVTLDLAACRVVEHQDDEAGQLIHTALDIAAGSLVRPIIDRAQDVRRHMARWTSTPAADDLDARLADLAS